MRTTHSLSHHKRDEMNLNIYLDLDILQKLIFIKVEINLMS
jgi:hypothetical protein